MNSDNPDVELSKTVKPTGSTVLIFKMSGA